MSKKRARKPDAWMPLYIGDYLRDTSSLTTEQHGAYMLLQMAMWPQGGRIALDDDELAAITRLGKARWKSQRVKLLRFFRVADGFLVHDRLAEEFAHATTVYEKRVTSGRQSLGRPPERDLFEETVRGGERGGERGPQSQSQSQPPASPSIDASGEIPKDPIGERARASLRKVCKELAGMGVECSTGDAHLRAALAEGFTADDILALSRTGKGAGKPPAYLLQALRGARADAQQQPGTASAAAVVEEDPELAAMEAEVQRLANVIYDARHLHDTLKSITTEDRDARIHAARQRISELEADIAEKRGAT